MTEGQLESWHSSTYAAEWAGDDVLSNLLELPRRISLALTQDADLDVTHVVDLGSGHGPYLELFLRAFPEATGTWVDSSEAMRDLATERLADFGDRIDFVLGDLEQLDGIDLPQAEVIVTSRVLHHFSPESLQRFYRTVHELVSPGGFFFNLDHIGPPGDWDARYRRIRKQFIGERKQKLAPHRHDYALSDVPDHLGWIAEAGFETPDVPWRTFYTVLLAARHAG
jgi:trans-aconitate methyltransferase